MRFGVPLASATLLGAAAAAWLPARDGDGSLERHWNEDFGGHDFSQGRPAWSFGWDRNHNPAIPPHYAYPPPPPPPRSSPSSSATASTTAVTSCTDSDGSATLSEESATVATSASRSSSSLLSGTARSVGSASAGVSISANSTTYTISSSVSVGDTSQFLPSRSASTSLSVESATGTVPAASSSSANANSTNSSVAATSTAANVSAAYPTTVGITLLPSIPVTSTLVVGTVTTHFTLTTSYPIISNSSIRSLSTGLLSVPGNSTSTKGSAGVSVGPVTASSASTVLASSLIPSGGFSTFPANSSTKYAPSASGSGVSTPSGGRVSVSANSTSYRASAGSSPSVLTSARPLPSANGTSSGLLTGSSHPIASASPLYSANTTLSSFSTGTGSPRVSAAPSLSFNATSTSTMAPTISPTTACSNLCSNTTFSGFDAQVYTCTAYNSGDTINVAPGQAKICGSTETAPQDLCRITLGVTTSSASEVFVEVWMPSDDDWNGRILATSNGGLNGCVDYTNMAYVLGKDFAVVGDNGGHNNSAFDGTWMQGDNERIIDWNQRARHVAIGTGKQVVNAYYGENANKAYYLGCSTGGQQGLKSAQTFPDDFDGIIAGSAASDFNHLQDWSGRFYLLTGQSGSDSYLSQDQWLTVQEEVLAQCDEPLDGVNDGVIEDPSLCINVFNSSALLDRNLTQAQVHTVNEIHTELYDQSGNLLFPAFLYGAEYDGYKTGLLSGTVQGITHDWFMYGVYNGSGFDASTLSQTDYTNADNEDALHGYVSSFNPDLSGFQSSGAKLLQYHGLADPMISGWNAQRYYQKVASSMGQSNSDLDSWYRLFRISGMAHCSVGGVSGAGAWMFGQDEESSVAPTNVIDLMVDWVENDNAPDTLLGTKFWYDEPSNGVQFQRPHCRFPYRTTYNGGDSTSADSWGCDYIDDWQDCGPGAVPRTC